MWEDGLVVWSCALEQDGINQVLDAWTCSNGSHQTLVYGKFWVTESLYHLRPDLVIRLDGDDISWVYLLIQRALCHRRHTIDPTRAGGFQVRYMGIFESGSLWRRAGVSISAANLGYATDPKFCLLL